MQIELGQAEPARVPRTRPLYRAHLRGPGPPGLPAPPPPSKGAQQRYGDPLPPRGGDAPSSSELNVIGDMGFPAYFLRRVGPDPLRPGVRNILVGRGRGSAAGCCVAYCLKIVYLDPIRYDLLFERFLNPGRKADARHRHGLRRALPGRRDRATRRRSTGSDRVAQIITFSTIKARAAVRDASPGPRQAVHRRRQDRQGHAAAP